MTSSLVDRLNGVSEQVAIKRPVRCASTANLTLSGFQTIDGITPVATDDNLRVLAKNQTTASENGIYTMASGAWERTADFDGNRDVIKGTRVPVAPGGTLNANKTYVVTTSDPIVIDTSSIAFSEITEVLVDAEFAKPQAPARTVTATEALDADDAGTLINVDCTLADVVITLPDGTDLTNGDQVGVRYAAGANQVIIVGDDTDAINGKSSFALVSRYEAVWLAWDGTSWDIVGHAAPFNIDTVVFVKVVNRTLTTPPVGPVPGARYIIAASGTPTGDWSTYNNNDLLESDGQSGWIRYTPQESWHAYIEAENKLCFYTGSAWQGLPNTDDPAASTLGYAVFEDQKSNGTVGGTATTAAWTARALNTSVVNSITDASLAANAITLPAGKYFCIATGAFWKTGGTQVRLKSTTTSTALTGPMHNIAATLQGGVATVWGILNLSAEEAFKLEYWAEATVGTSDLGSPMPTQAETEIYASVQIIDLASLQGGVGDQGAQGPQGFAGYKYQYSSTTTQTDPGAGFLRLNNADFSLVTAAVIDATSAETGNPDVSDEIAAWDDTGGILRLCEVASEQNFASYTVTDVVDNGTHLSLTLVYRDHATGFANNDNVSLQFTAKGEPGAAGSSVLALDYQFNTATAGDPGSGKILGNNAALASITTIHMHRLDRLGADVETLIQAFDDLGATTGRGHLYIIDVTTPTNRATYLVTGSVTDAGDYDTFAVTYVNSAGSFANNTRVAVLFVPAGATGAIGGALGAVDNVIPRTDGAGGASLQDSRNTIADDGKITVNLLSTAASIASAIKVSHIPSVVGATGVGVGLDFETKNGSSVAFTAAAIQAEARTVVSSSEDADLVFKVITNGTLTERMRLRDYGNLDLGSSNAFALKGSGQQTLSGGFGATPLSLGSVSSSTITVTPSTNNFYYYTNAGAHQINPLSADGYAELLMVNSSNGGGSVSFSSNFTIGTTPGDSLPVAASKYGLIALRRINSISTYIPKTLSTSS